MMAIDHSVVPDVPALQVTVTESTTAAAENAGRRDDEAEDLDRLTAAYVLASQRHFEDLRQTAGQLAGLLVLAASGSKSITPEHALLAAARIAYRESAANLRCLTVPARARHQHDHLMRAVGFLGIALRHCERDLAAYAQHRRNIGDALRPLQRGYRHLQHAAALLPGYEIIGFAQGCCASHPAVANHHPHPEPRKIGVQR